MHGHSAIKERVKTDIILSKQPYLCWKGPSTVGPVFWRYMVL